MKRDKLYEVVEKVLICNRKIHTRKYLKYAKNNKSFKNCHNGERCFILGNGPSIKEFDFELLKNEYVFTVNQIARNPNYNKMKSSYHFWADPIFFNLDLSKEENQELFNQMKKIKNDVSNPVNFIPADFYDYVQKTELDKDINVQYFIPCGNFKYYRKCDFSKRVSSYFTVVQYAILMAIYMGFNEIYILGCETTSIVTAIKNHLNEDMSNTYAYEITENEKKRMTEMRKRVPLTTEAYAFYKVLEDYELLNQLCVSKGIKLINCTPNSVIDSIEKKSIQDVLGIKNENPKQI